MFESAALCLHLADLQPEAGLIAEAGNVRAGVAVPVVLLRDDRARGAPRRRRARVVEGLGRAGRRARRGPESALRDGSGRRRRRARRWQVDRRRPLLGRRHRRLRRAQLRAHGRDHRVASRARPLRRRPRGAAGTAARVYAHGVELRARRRQAHGGPADVDPAARGDGDADAARAVRSPRPAAPRSSPGGVTRADLAQVRAERRSRSARRRILDDAADGERVARAEELAGDARQTTWMVVQFALVHAARGAPRSRTRAGRASRDVASAMIGWWTPANASSRRQRRVEVGAPRSPAARAAGRVRLGAISRDVRLDRRQRGDSVSSPEASMATPTTPPTVSSARR